MQIAAEKLSGERNHASVEMIVDRCRLRPVVQRDHHHRKDMTGHDGAHQNTYDVEVVGDMQGLRDHRELGVGEDECSDKGWMRRRDRAGSGSGCGVGEDSHVDTS